MLVITVKEGQSVKIGNSELKLISIKGSHVRIAFDFPRETKILRGALDDGNSNVQNGASTCGESGKRSKTSGTTGRRRRYVAKSPS